MISSKRSAAAGVALVAAALVLAACGSSGGGGGSSTAAGSSSASSTGGTGGGNAGLQAATAVATKYQQQPTQLDVTTPLSKKPPSGKLVYYIITADPNSVRVATGFKQAATALGWKTKILSWTDPSQVSGLILQGVQAHADYISYIAVPSAILGKAIAAAKAAKIPIFQSYDATTPEGTKNWIFGNIGGVNDFALRGKVLADYLISKTNGKANVLMENVPAFTVLTAFAKAFEAEFKKNCPSCGYATNNSQYADVAGGKVPATLVSYLRTHTKVNNVVFSTGSFDTGFAQAAQAAGIKIGDGGVQISGQALSPANEQAVKSGQELANVSSGDLYGGWLVVDGMARYSVGDDLTPNYKAVTTPRILTKDSVGGGLVGASPPDFAQKFKTLWKLG